MSSKRKSWFDVDPRGLAQLIGDRGKEFVVYELLQNAWDESSTNVTVSFIPASQPGLYSLIVTDDNPDGFADLTHAYTMFAPSAKKSDPTKRGRFNLGEKLVIALCKEATIMSTKGTVRFDSTGRHDMSKRTEKGSIFEAIIRMNRDEYNAALTEIRKVIPPLHIRTTVNGEELPEKKPVRTFEVKLTTVLADKEGVMRTSRRLTTVEVHEVEPGDTAKIYEMGIPVVATGDKWHYNVMQKVPLNSDRTDVTPAYKQDIRTEVLNHMVDRIAPSEASDAWVRDASSDENVAPEVVEQVMTKRFGEKRVIFDTSDPEANKRAVAEGYSLIYSKSLSADEWKNVKAAGAALPAGQVTPSPKPFHPDGEPLQTIPVAQWTKPMWRYRRFVDYVVKELIGRPLSTFTMADDRGWGHRAAFGQSRDLVVNWATEGAVIRDAFERDLTSETAGKIAPIVDLLIHEFAHYSVSDHLSEEYYRELTRLGGKFTALALRYSEVFTKHTDA